MKDLSGKVILITRASSGIGRAAAELAASRGAKVILNYNKDASDYILGEIITVSGGR